VVAFAAGDRPVEEKRAREECWCAERRPAGGQRRGRPLHRLRLDSRTRCWSSAATLLDKIERAAKIVIANRILDLIVACLAS